MFGNDPKFQQAMKMAQGKTPDQLKETAFNLAKTQGIDPIKEQKDLGLTNDILMETFKSAIKPLKYSDKEVYDEVVDKLYKECYGEHFSDWLAEKAVENFKNVDGTEGAHWSVEQIDDVIRQYGIKCIGFNRWDLYFVMNMLYSDYYNVLGSDTATYVKMSKAWFEDPDVSEGKAYRYYMQVAKA